MAFKVDLEAKDEVKFMYVHHAKYRTQRNFYVAVITTTGKYEQQQIVIMKPQMTKKVCLRIKKLFSKYKLTTESEVLVGENFEYYEPIYVYLDFVHQHIPFKRRNVTVQGMLRKIFIYHGRILRKKTKSTQIGANYLNKIWNKLIEKKCCPWITKEYNYQLETVGESTRKNDLITVRLAMYYAFVHDALRKKIARYQANKRIRDQQQMEQTDEMPENSTLSTDI